MSESKQQLLYAWIVFGLIVFSIAQNVFLNFGASGFALAVTEAAFTHRSLPDFYRQVDQLFANVPRTGNVWLIFQGFGPDDKAAIETIYYRSAYTLYPRRVIVASPGTVINHGRDILNVQFSPTQDWLVQNRVTSRTDLVRDANGNITINQVAIPP